MSLEFGTRKDALRACFHQIELDVLHRLNKPQKYRHYTYEELAALSGHEPEDWKSDGWIRRMMYGLAGRSWLEGDFRLWFKADENNHAGLVFTADPRLGLAWFVDLKTDEFTEGAKTMDYLSRRAEVRDERFRDYFRKVGRRAQRIRDAAENLNKLREPAYLRRLGIAPPA